MKVTIVATPELAALAKEAESIQDAGSLRGLSQRFAQVMAELDNQSTPRSNQHPITCMWLYKFASLAHLEQDFNKMSLTYAACRKLAAGEDVEIDVIY